jgi:hypothetical protein
MNGTHYHPAYEASSKHPPKGIRPLVGGGAIRNTFIATAVPQGIGTTGQRGFFSNESGVIRYTLTGVAPTVASSPLQ